MLVYVSLCVGLETCPGVPTSLTETAGHGHQLAEEGESGEEDGWVLVLQRVKVTVFMFLFCCVFQLLQEKLMNSVVKVTAVWFEKKTKNKSSPHLLFSRFGFDVPAILHSSDEPESVTPTPEKHMVQVTNPFALDLGSGPANVIGEPGPVWSWCHKEEMFSVQLFWVTAELFVGIKWLLWMLSCPSQYWWARVSSDQRWQQRSRVYKTSYVVWFGDRDMDRKCQNWKCWGSLWRDKSSHLYL